MPPSTRRAEVLAAVPTLVDHAGELDVAANTAMLADLAGRVDGVFLAGTTGEFPALALAERALLLEIALEAFGPDGVVAHIGAAATRDAVALARDAVAAGARRLAVITPYYLAVDASATTRHFAAVTAAAGDAAVHGYLFPERTGVPADPAVFAAAAAEAGLAGAKLSGAAGAALPAFVAALPAGAVLWAGSDAALAATVRAGGRGVVSALASAFPAPLAGLADAVASGDAEAERTAQAEVDELVALAGGGPLAVKHAMALRGIGTETMRMPVPDLSPQVRDGIARLVARAGARAG